MKSLRNIQTMGAMLVGSLVGVAHAAEVIVYDVPINDRTQEVSAEFAVNRELGRAWIDVTLTTNSIGEEPPDERVIEKKVDGLYYDPARKQVLFRTSSSEPIVCAEDASFLWRTYLKTTGQCQLSSHTEERKVDNGFDVREQTVAEVTFNPQTSPAPQHTAVTSV